MISHRTSRLIVIGVLVLCALTLSASLAQEATETPAPAGTPVIGLANSVQGNAVITETLPFSDEMLNRLELPEGFTVNVFARGLGNARWMSVMPDGYILLTRRAEGDLVALVDADGDGIADSPDVNVIASDLPYLHGITLFNNRVYLATDTTVYVADYLGAGQISGLTTIINNLPTGGQHPNRTLAVGPDNLLYITVGSTCNACDEVDPRIATVLRTNLDGTNLEVYATGLRNTIGFGWHPTTEQLWGFDQGSDWRGDDQPPEELNQIRQNVNYGWPWCYADQQPDVFVAVPPPSGVGRAVYCQTTEPATLTYTAHSAAIAMVYYTADQFPAEYRNDAFVTMRGSWNRQPPSGYKLVRVVFGDDGSPVEVQDFMTGFLIEEQLANIGRIAGLAVASDGSLLVSEDQNGIIFRISYSE